MKLLRSSTVLPGIPVQKSRLPDDLLQDMRCALTFNNGAYFQAQKRGAPTTGIPRHLYAFTEDKKYLYLPRHFPWTDFPLSIRATVIDSDAVNYARIKPVKIKAKIRSDQREVFPLYQEQINRGKDGILSLAPGKGKTVLSVLAWASMRHTEPALAIVTTLTIGGQWKDRLLECTNISEDDIGYIGDGKMQWKNKKFVIATLQSLAQKQFPPEFYTRFGVIFFDECHRLGAPSFGKVAGLFSGTRIGLSATWARADGLEKLFMLHLGQVFYEDREQVLNPDIYFVRTPVELDLKKFRMWGRGRQQGDINHARVLTHLSRLSERQAFILRFVNDAYSQGRKVLVLGDRKEELVTLKESIGHGNCGICVGSLDGRSLKREEQQDALSKPIVFATSQLVKEGLDQPDIDTLIICYPQSNAAFAEQAVGRILRRDKGKKKPIVVVLCDSGLWIEGQPSLADWTWGGTTGRRNMKVYPFKRTCERMQATFKKLGYNVVRKVK